MERFYWIELIGFDNEKADFGVQAFISRTVSITGVSLLFSHIDFIFDEENETLSPRACSYFGHEYNKERKRQTWTRTQLKGLIFELKSRGIKVFLSSFDMTDNITDPDMRCYNASGKVEKLIYPIKPLKDGRSVGDLIIEKLKRAIEFYGFDGLQLADGLSSSRLSIENGDFSLPLCQGFPVKIPKALMKEGEEEYVKRRAFILKHARYKWTMYLKDLWADFYRKLFRSIKEPIFFNSTWTRDGFEALYRYGLDYTLCNPTGAYGIMVEENSATRAITNRLDEGGVEFPLEDRKRFTYEYWLMQQNIRIMTGGLKQISLTPISDTMEQWDAIRHCPTELSRAIVRRFNSFVYREGKFEVCCDAPHYCLSDGVPESDWRWLAKQEGYRIPSPDFIDGFAAVCNPGALYSDLRQFCEKKHYYGSALLLELVANGLNYGAKIAISEAEGFDKAKCLVVTDLNAYSKEDKEALCRSSLPILAVGEDVDLPLTPASRYDGKYISVALYNSPVCPDLHSLCGLEKIRRGKKISHGEIWTEALSYKRVDPLFFIRLSEIMNTAFGLEHTDNRDIKVSSYLSGGEKYIMLSSDSYIYELPFIKTSTPINTAVAIMKDTGYKVRLSNDGFTVRIPPRSLEIIKAEV